MLATRVVAALTEADSELGQVLAVLEAAGLEEPFALPVSEGDRALVALARRLTGSDLELVAECPRCELLNEVTLVPEIFPPTAPRVAPLGQGGVREPTYGDLVGLPDDEAEATAELLRRCTVGKPLARLTAAALELVDDALSGPVVFACVDCEAPMTIDADIQQLALARLGALARELEHDVNLLAQAYGWSLAEIDGLPYDRRRRLAALVSGGR